MGNRFPGRCGRLRVYEVQEMSHKRRKKDCPSGKVRYTDHKEAVAHLRWINNVSTADKTPCRVYECEYCNGWHLTSTPNGVKRGS